MSYREIFESNNVDLQTILNKVNELPEASSGSADPVLQEKIVSPSTSSQSITADSGYDGLSKVTVNAIPTATQATPSISVSSGGLITTSSTQSEGYVTAGTKSATKQLTVQAAQTIIPGTSNKTIASGRYLTGTQTIKGDSNLKAENIKSGVSIFGVSGSYSGDGSSTVDDVSKAIIERTITEISDSNIRTIGDHIFYNCKHLETVNFPNAVYIQSGAFLGCSKLTSIYLPKAEIVSSRLFYQCTSLTTVDLPRATSVDDEMFYYCESLATVNLPRATSVGDRGFYYCFIKTLNLPKVTSIGAYAFYNTYLTSLVLRSTTLCSLSNKNAFSSTYIEEGKGYIYVPSSLLSQYQAATNWATYAAQFRALEDYTVDGTITGALDESKI